MFQQSQGVSNATHNGGSAFEDNYSFPFNVNFTILNANGSQCKLDPLSPLDNGNLSLFVMIVDATFDHSYDRDLFPSPFILATTIQERQLASGFFTIASSGNSGNGTSTNTFTYSDDEGNTYDREVSAVDNVITADHQGGNLPPFDNGSAGMSGASSNADTAPAGQKREAFSAGQDLVAPRFLASRGFFN